MPPTPRDTLPFRGPNAVVFPDHLGSPTENWRMAPPWPIKKARRSSNYLDAKYWRNGPPWGLTELERGEPNLCKKLSASYLFLPRAPCPPPPQVRSTYTPPSHIYSSVRQAGGRPVPRSPRAWSAHPTGPRFCRRRRAYTMTRNDPHSQFPSLRSCRDIIWCSCDLAEPSYDVDSMDVCHAPFR